MQLCYASPAGTRWRGVIGGDHSPECLPAARKGRPLLEAVATAVYIELSALHRNGSVGFLGASPIKAPAAKLNIIGSLTQLHW